ncbi:hypothetical protein Gohar_003805 [Gossypium harknessii]|uniref:RNase H type-1 domain-containing protein n=1 Tax=Gossypium harknessii TaxID=34285 RepID=A0A7J9IAB4_9ROSI|nr:hypothetical protein [Gossypium harknessii]
MLLKHHLVPYPNQGQTDAYTGGIDEGSISSQRDKSIEPSNDTNSEANSPSVYQIIEVHRFPHQGWYNIQKHQLENITFSPLNNTFLDAFSILLLFPFVSFIHNSMLKTLVLRSSFMLIVFQVKVRAIREGLHLLWNRGYRQIMIESENTLSVQTFVVTMTPTME